MNNDENAYFTFKGYQLNNDSNLTSSMEDYLEMKILMFYLVLISLLSLNLDQKSCGVFLQHMEVPRLGV